jgi:hypothetical protein
MEHAVSNLSAFAGHENLRLIKSPIATFSFILSHTSWWYVPILLKRNIQASQKQKRRLLQTTLPL